MKETASIWLEKSLLGTNSSSTIIVQPGQTILHALQHANIQLRQPVAAIVNGKTVDLVAYVLRSGDKVQLVPQIGGG